MGGLAVDNAEIARKYGVLGTRFNTMREFYECVREAVNTQTDPEGCIEQ